SCEWFAQGAPVGGGGRPGPQGSGDRPHRPRYAPQFGVHLRAVRPTRGGGDGLPQPDAVEVAAIPRRNPARTGTGSGRALGGSAHGATSVRRRKTHPSLALPGNGQNLPVPGKTGGRR